jgi:hypothetical protein
MPGIDEKIPLGSMHLKNKSVIKSQLLFILSILWIFLIILGYYYWHKPINSETAGSVFLSILDLIASLAIISLAGGIGRKILPLNTSNPLERAAVQAALGALILGLFWLGLGAAHLYSTWAAWLILLAGLIVFRKQVMAWIREFAFTFKSWKSAGKLEKSFALIFGIFVLFQLVIALAPPLKWDALAYHLELPRQYLQAGYLIYLPDNPYWGYPQINEMLYTFAIALHRSQTAAVVSWGFGLVFLLGMVGFTNSLYTRLTKGITSENPGWVAATALIAGYTVRNMLGWSYTDLLGALFGLATISLFFQWMDDPDPALFRWTALFGGAAATVKWTNGMLLLGLALCLPFLYKTHRFTFKLLLQSAGIIFLVIFPWLLKNLIATGSPIFPYFFPTANYDSVRLAINNYRMTDVPLWQRLLLPFAITFTGVDSMAGYSTDLGPLLLLFGIPGLICFWRDQKTKVLVAALIPAVLGISVVSYWIGTLYQPRLYFSLLAIAAAPAGLGWMALKEKNVFNVRLNRILGVIVWVVLAFCISEDGIEFIRLNPWQVITNEKYTSAYLTRGTGPYSDAVEKIDQLNADARVMMLWEPRGLYMPKTSQADLWIDRFLTDYRHYQTPEKIIENWCAAGFDHVLVYKMGEELIKPAAGSSSALWKAYQETRALMGEGENIDGMYDLYSLSCQPGK